MKLYLVKAFKILCRLKEFWYVLGLSLLVLTLTLTDQALQGNVPVDRLLVSIPVFALTLTLVIYAVILLMVICLSEKNPKSI